MVDVDDIFDDEGELDGIIPVEKCDVQTVEVLVRKLGVLEKQKLILEEAFSLAIKTIQLASKERKDYKHFYLKLASIKIREGRGEAEYR
jgi:hypothetical protein